MKTARVERKLILESAGRTLAQYLAWRLNMIAHRAGGLIAASVLALLLGACAGRTDSGTNAGSLPGSGAGAAGSAGLSNGGSAGATAGAGGNSAGSGGSLTAGSFACGTSTCSATQMCVARTCGGGPVLCEDEADGGCTPGWHVDTCGATGKLACVPDPCANPAPECVEIPAACGAALNCTCIPSDVCNGYGTCQSVVNVHDVTCGAE